MAVEAPSPATGDKRRVLGSATPTHRLIHLALEHLNTVRLRPIRFCAHRNNLATQLGRNA